MVSEIWATVRLHPHFEQRPQIFRERKQLLGPVPDRTGLTEVEIFDKFDMLVDPSVLAGTDSKSRLPFFAAGVFLSTLCLSFADAETFRASAGLFH